MPSPADTSDPARPVEWAVSDRLVAYDEAVAIMEHRVERIARGEAPEIVWLLEHPPIYTAGTSARPQDLVAPHRFPVFQAGRGGQYTYHGPGQRVVYAMLDIRRHASDLRRFVGALEGWVIDTLARFNVTGEVREGRVGVWVRRPEKGPGIEDKIAALGIRVRRSVSFHGISINVEPEIEHFSGIVPCGIREHGVTSLADLGLTTTMHELDMALRAAFEARFATTTRDVACPALRRRALGKMD